MRLLQSIAVSILLHGFLFCIPFAMVATAPPVCDTLSLVIVGAGNGESSAKTDAPGPAVQDEQQSEPPPAMEESGPDLPDENDAAMDETIPPPEKKPDQPLPAPEAPPPAIKKVVHKRVPKAKHPSKPPKEEPRVQTVPKVEPPPPEPPAAVDSGIPSEEQVAAVSTNASGSGPPGAAGSVESSFGAGDGPRFIKKVMPIYPKLARQLGKEGTVLLRLTIDERGHLLGVEVLKRAGSGLDEAAVKAMRESAFRPAEKNGKPIACRVRAPIRFVLRSAGND